MRGRDLAQIDLLPGPAGPYGRQRRYDSRILINAAQRVGVPSLGAARVEKEIVKVPKDQIAVALGLSKAAVAAGVNLEKDLAIQQQAEKLDPWESAQQTELFDSMRHGQHRQGGGDLRVANPE